MTKKEYKIIDSIQRACTEDWGLETDVLSTKEHFGTEQDMELPGQWVWVCRLKDDTLAFIDESEADATLTADNSVYLFREVTKRVYFIGNERMLIDHDSNRLRFS